MLNLCFLGRPLILDGGEPVTGFVSDKALALFSYLALNEGFHSRQSLAGLLWGDVSEKRARRSLRVALHNLRQLFPDYLDVTRKEAAFVQDRAVQIDVRTFEGLVRQNEVDALDRAAALYCGSFLEGLVVDGQAAFEAWRRGEQERLRLLLLQVLERLADRQAAQGCLVEAEQTVRRLLALEPWSEVFHRRLMLLLARQGKYGAALAQFEQCRDALATGLKLDPMPETEALKRRIQRLRITPRPNLPAQSSPLLGRERELEELYARLVSDQTRLLTIVGLGGVGKTRLAVEVAARQRPFFLDGVFWVSLSGTTEHTELPGDLLTALGTESGPEQTPRERLLDFLRNKELLLVLDNFEHLLGGTALVGEILQTAPAVNFLVTSRVPLRLQAEHVYSLYGFRSADWQTRAEANADPAVQLFLEHARRISPSFALQEDELPALRALLRLTDGLPLALILVAGFAEVLTLREIVTEIDNSLDFLESTHGDLPTRQRSIRAIFEATLERLSERERARFAALSVFRGGFTMEAARAVTGCLPRDLVRFAALTIVTRGMQGRFGVHELLRQFAAERLALGGAEAALDAHSCYYMQTLARLLPDLKGRDQLGALDFIDADFDNLRTAWRRAAAQGHWEHFQEASQSLCLYSLFRSRHFDGIELFQVALASNRATQSARAHLLAGRNLLQQRVDRRDEMLASIPELRAATEATADPDTIAYCRLMLGQTLHYRSEDREEAALLLASARRYYTEVQDPFYSALALWREGLVQVVIGQECRGMALWRRGVKLARSAGDRYVTGTILHNLGSVTANREGPTEQAERYFREAVALRSEVGARAHYAHSLGTLSLLLDSREGDVGPGLALLEEALAIARAHDVPYIQASLLGQLAWYRVREQQYEESLALTAEALSFTRKGSYVWANLCAVRGITLLSLGDTNEAALFLKRFLTARVSDAQLHILDGHLAYLGIVLARQDKPDLGAELFAYGLGQTGYLPAPGLAVDVFRFQSELEEALGEAGFAAAWDRGSLLDPTVAVTRALASFES